MASARRRRRTARLRCDGAEALPVHARADPGAAGGARRARRAGAPPPRAGLPRGLRARARPPAGGVPHRRRTCSSSPAPAPAPSSRRSSTSARRASACSPCPPATSASAGRRWRATFGCEVEELRYAWGETPIAEDLARRLAEIEPVSLVFLVHSETSTGVVADIQALAAAAKDAGALVVVDAVSSLGAVPLETDDWGLDVVVSGLAEGADDAARPRDRLRLASRRGSRSRRRRCRASTSTGSGRGRRRQKLDSAFTPAVSLVVALDVALGLLLEDGLEAAFERHVRLGRACRAGIKAMGLELFSPDEDRSAVVTAARMPDGMRLRRADARAPRSARHHDRRRPGRAQGRDLPDRPHRLVRRVRHRDGALRRRARARRARRADRARRRRDPRARGLRRRDAV